MDKIIGSVIGIAGYLYISVKSQNYIIKTIAHDLKNSESELFAGENEQDIQQ